MTPLQLSYFSNEFLIYLKDIAEIVGAIIPGHFEPSKVFKSAEG